MAEFPALPLWTDAWVADTHHLSIFARGLYMDLLILMWRTPGCRVPADRAWLMQRLHISDSVFDNELKPLIKDLCQRIADSYVQKRLQREYEWVKARKISATENAKRRWEKEKQVCGGNAPTPTPIPLKKNILSAVPADFEAFWQAYPREKNMSKKRALMAWRKLSAEKRMQAAAAVPGYRSYCEKNKSWYHTVHAERFLSHERFEGFAAEHQPTAEEIETARDKADQLLRRGKYAETYT